jgi:hypothetical protein
MSISIRTVFVTRPLSLALLVVPAVRRKRQEAFQE